MFLGMLPVPSVEFGAEAFIDPTGLTTIGDFTNNLSAAFDGSTNVSFGGNPGSTLKQTGDLTFGYVGKTLAVSRPITKFEIWGSNDRGYIDAIDPTVTISLYAKAGSVPANSTDGTLLATITPFGDLTNESGMRTATSSDQATEFNHVWARVSHNGAANIIGVGEVKFYGLTP